MDEKRPRKDAIRVVSSCFSYFQQLEKFWCVISGSQYKKIL